MPAFHALTLATCIVTGVSAPSAGQTRASRPPTTVWFGAGMGPTSSFWVFGGNVTAQFNDWLASARYAAHLNVGGGVASLLFSSR